jgi:hypothetical protein
LNQSVLHIGIGKVVLDLRQIIYGKEYEV